MIALSLVFGKEVVTAICSYGPQVVRLDGKKDQFYNEMAGERDLQNLDEVLDMGELMGTLGDRLMVLKVCLVEFNWTTEILI